MAEAAVARAYARQFCSSEENAVLEAVLSGNATVLEVAAATGRDPKSSRRLARELRIVLRTDDDRIRLRSDVVDAVHAHIEAVAAAGARRVCSVCDSPTACACAEYGIATVADAWDDQCLTILHGILCVCAAADCVKPADAPLVAADDSLPDLWS